MTPSLRTLVRKSAYVRITDRRDRLDPVAIYRLIPRSRARDDVRVQRHPRLRDAKVAFFATSRLLSPVDPLVVTWGQLRRGKRLPDGIKCGPQTLQFLDAQNQPLAVAATA